MFKGNALEALSIIEGRYLLHGFKRKQQKQTYIGVPLCWEDHSHLLRTSKSSNLNFSKTSVLLKYRLSTFHDWKYKESRTGNPCSGCLGGRGWGRGRGREGPTEQVDLMQWEQLFIRESFPAWTLLLAWVPFA